MKELFHKINSNLKAKIVIFMAGILLLFLLGSVFYNIRAERTFYLKSIENQLRLLAGTIEESLVDSMGRDRRDEVQRIMERIGGNEDISDLRIFSDSRVILRSSNPSEIGSPIDDENYVKYKESADTFVFSKAGQKKLFLVKPIMNRPACYGCHDSRQKVNGVLEVSFSLTRAEAAINQHLKSMMVAALAISAFLAFAVFLVLEFLINSPIRRLRASMEKVERGEDVDLSHSPSADEIGRLHAKFVEMVGSIQDLNSENTRKEMELVKNLEMSNSHARLTSMLEAMPDGVSILTPDMVVHDINRRNTEIFPGIRKGDFCYRSIHGRSEPCAHCGVIKVFEDGQVHEHQSTFYLPDGKDRIVHSISAPLKDRDGNITHAIEVVRDITERVKAEKLKMDAELKHKKELEAVNQQLFKRVKEVEEANKQIATLIKDLASKNTELEKVVDRLTTVNRIGNILNSILDKDNVLEVIVNTLAKTMGAKICSLMLVNEATSELEVAYAVGLEGLKLRKVKMGEGVSGYVAKEGVPLLVSDIEKDPRFQISNDPQYTTTSLLAAPLFIKGKVVGVLNINNKLSGDAFNQDELDLLTTVAGQAAIAVENSNLYRDIRASYFDTVRALVNALEAKDKYSKGHSERVTLLAMMMADEMGLPEPRKQALQHAGVLHDIGKIGISMSILNKDGKLTGEEYDLVKDHPLIGEKILDPITFLKDVKVIVGEHHERYDGKGYPHQKSGDELSLEAKILAVADTFDALTSDRPYRKALPFEDAVAEIRRCSNTQFDPEVVDAFMKTINGSGSVVN